MDPWWLVYTMIMVPVGIIMAAAIALGIWANRAETIEDEDVTHVPAE